jgi:hypothetical protein
MLTVSKRRDAVKGQPGRSSPDNDIAVLQPKAPWLVSAFQAAKQKDRR